MDALIDLENRYGAFNYHPLDVVLCKGKGVWVWDHQGNQYLDMLSAYSAISHGHCHPRILQALQRQSEKLCVTSRAFYNECLGPLLQKASQLSGLDRAIPMNTGAEAVETGIKAARLWGYKVKKIPKDRAEIIVARGNFHGRTSGIIGFSSELSYKEGFGPFMPGFVEIPFGDADALEKAITPHTCAFLVEPMQGEAGIIIPPFGWLKKVRRICEQHGILLILDEVQTGLGRTGKTFAFQHEEILPDGLILGKALGGGVLPISLFIGTEEVLSLFTPGSHGSTFGGNPLASAVALEALQVMEEEQLAQRSLELGQYFLSEIRAMKSGYIKEVRGKGLWIGIELTEPARSFCEQLKHQGILVKETHETVLRLAPPLVITKEELDWALPRLKEVLC